MLAAAPAHLAASAEHPRHGGLPVGTDPLHRAARACLRMVEASWLISPDLGVLSQVHVCWLHDPRVCTTATKVYGTR